VEGIGVGFEPTFLDQSVLKGIKAIDQEKRFAMFRQLAHEYSLPKFAVLMFISDKIEGI